MLTNVVAAAVGLAGGAFAGLVFFGGLAATVRRLPGSARPAGLVLGSLLGRLAVVAVVMVGLALLGVGALLAGLVALLVVRTSLTRRVVPDARPGPMTGGGPWT